MVQKEQSSKAGSDAGSRNTPGSSKGGTHLMHRAGSAGGGAKALPSVELANIGEVPTKLST
eukprot:2454757-Pyramimonas_sp.AAC.1